MRELEHQDDTVLGDSRRFQVKGNAALGAVAVLDPALAGNQVDVDQAPMNADCLSHPTLIRR